MLRKNYLAIFKSFLGYQKILNERRELNNKQTFRFYSRNYNKKGEKLMKKFVILLVSISLLVSILSFSACADQIQLNFIEAYTNPDRKILLKEIISDYEKLNPDIKINLISPPYEQATQKIVLMLNTKQPLDIVEVKADTIGMYVANNFIINLEDRLAEWKDSKTLLPSVWKVARTVDEKAYVVPSSVYGRRT